MRVEQIGNALLFNADCMDVMRVLPPVDMVLTDPPYGTTQCKWDSVIPLDKMWAALRCCTGERTAIVMTASQPFTSALVMSNLKMFKYEWTWTKSRKTGQLNAKKRPLLAHENVLVFYQKMSVYAPYTEEDNPLAGTRATPTTTDNYRPVSNQGAYVRPDKLTKNTVLSGFDVGAERGSHPTQKPVALMEYLIKTYTLPGETVLDFTMGSGTTGVACARQGRNFIGIELDPTYFDIACNRIREEQQT